VKGLFHSDELPAYGITGEEILEINKELRLDPEDAFVLVAEKSLVAEKALKAVVDRSRLALHGVPEETRRGLPDGRSEFMRPLPGSARMYPETDEPLVVIDNKFISGIKKNLSEMPEEKIERFLGMGLSKELANQLLKSKWAAKFEEFRNEFMNVKPSVIATTLISTPKEVKRRYKVEVGSLGEDHYQRILGLVDSKRISKDVIPEIMAELARDPTKAVEEILEEKDLGFISMEELEGIVDEILDENSELIQDAGGKAVGQITGKVMAEVKGRADAGLVREIIGGKLKNR
ncbi:MAG: Glu-tRNA(Gln) amidotransferase GatDE subunit E, partial [Candidatus Altiarchaeota archaeon]|nr:Glu-tRNA(Gln) amidotransferase GatDE subunit E [Candidatus Altiarchaeota archaeon]